ncbi:MAG TPA: hypothetical protein VJQ25_00315, partial [Nitrospira sp.]|nr:hypothetical protein [Nitrospira sp.]
RRPILLIGGEGATANLVQRHRVGLTASNHVDHIRRLILDVVEGRQSLSVPGSDEVDRFNYQSLTGKLAKVLDEVYQEKGRKLP